LFRGRHFADEIIVLCVRWSSLENFPVARKTRSAGFMKAFFQDSVTQLRLVLHLHARKHGCAEQFCRDRGELHKLREDFHVGTLSSEPCGEAYD
jgi:hypothetical protein